MRKIVFYVGICAGVLTTTGCSPYSPEDDTPDAPYTGPGTQEWGEVDLTCNDVGDCLTGEICSEGYCQVDRCGGDLMNSYPPLGRSYYFSKEDEIVLADQEMNQGTYYLNAFDPRSVEYEGSFDLGNKAPVDVAGGALWGARPQGIYAAAYPNSKKVEIAGSNESVNMPFTPIALAATDTDLDGLDELIAASSSGRIAICDVEIDECSEFSMSNVSIIDLAAADIDGDAFGEIVLLLDSGDTRYLYAFNPDAELTGQEESWSTSVSDDVIRISAGDLDNDRIAEITALRDGGYFDYWDDTLELYLVDPSGSGMSKLMDFETDGYGDGRDLEIADQDGDGDSEIYLLESDARVVTYTLVSNALQNQGQVIYSPSSDPYRITAADHNGDAPVAELKGNGIPCQGNPVPMMLMVLPPYDEDFANGTSRVGFGNGEMSSESVSESISLGLSVDIGYKAGFTEAFSAKVSTRMGWRISASVSNSTSFYVGTSYTLIADPDMYGPKYGGVVLSWGCFDGYEYEVDDPQDFLDGADGESLVLTVPTGGGSSIWSTPRYNALAAISDGLPHMEIPYQVGKVNTYPTSKEKLDGSKLKQKDMLFTDPPLLIASDVSRVSWTSRVSESETNSKNEDIDVSANAGVTVGGISVGMGVSAGWGSGYSLTVGKEARFSGTLPPLPDDPGTPEDEYTSHTYGLRPYVYIQDYETADGSDAAFYVQTYTVEK